MIDCPATLHSGADLIVSLSVYLKAAAFLPPNVPNEERSKNMFGEGQETEAEQILRQRKSSLTHLFDVLELRPTSRGSMYKRGKKGLTQEDLALLTQQEKMKQSKEARSAKTEIVGDGEEIEIEAGEEDLSENQLNLIYKK